MSWHRHRDGERGYHHGNLKEALIEAALDLIAKKGPAGFTFAAALTLALGIGANTAIFSVIIDVLLRDLPYAEPERLVMLWERNTRRDQPMNVVSPANFQDWRDASKSFEAMGAFFDRGFTLTGAGEPVEVRATAVTANMFEMLGAKAGE